MNFNKVKFRWAIWIMGIGMLLALTYNAWEGLGRGKGYPYNTFLLSPFITFSDYSDDVISSQMPNPYIDPQNFYLPFVFVAFRLPALVPIAVSLTVFLFLTLGALMILLVRTLENIVENPWLRVGASLLLLGLSYPIVFCVDRANIEIGLMVCIACCLYFYSRGRYLVGTLWLIPAVSCKIYPLLFLILLVRQRKWFMAVFAVAAFATITAICLHFVDGSLSQFQQLYSRNMGFFTQNMVYENNFMTESASPWNMYKIMLIVAGNAGVIYPVNFDTDGSVIRASYSCYMVGAFAFAALLTVYSWFIEKEFQRCTVVALLFLTIAIPTGGDYRMLYVCIALAFLVQIKSRRPFDLLAVMLCALVLVPKKVFFFSFLDSSIVEAFPTYPDVSIQVVLNPLLMIAAMTVLIFDSFRAYDAKWTALRVRRILVSLPFVGRPLIRHWRFGIARDESTSSR